jgi:type I restriction enzyme M protein
MSRISQQELESYLWRAAVLLRGLIDAGDYKQFIFPLLFFKRVSDVWDEEYQSALVESDGDLSYAQFAENHRFQIPEGVHWNDVRQTPKNVGSAIQKAMRAILGGKLLPRVTISTATLKTMSIGCVPFRPIWGYALL